MLLLTYKRRKAALCRIAGLAAVARRQHKHSLILLSVIVKEIKLIGHVMNLLLLKYCFCLIYRLETFTSILHRGDYVNIFLALSRLFFKA